MTPGTVAEPQLSVSGELHRQGARDPSLSEVEAELRKRLEPLTKAVAGEGMAPLALEGRLIRPLLAASLLSDGPESAPFGFWDAALAIQFAHEASLVHDDIVDGAEVRRGSPTVVARHGTAAAVVRGDHLLTTAYRLAIRSGSFGFAQQFARAVERTVAGEMAQASELGHALTWEQYSRIACGKAGELLGCSLAAIPVLERWENAPAVFDLGCRLGLLYQMLDDLLDYCPAADTGKAPLADFAQRRWTWVLEELPLADPFATTPGAVVERFHAFGTEGPSPAMRCLMRLEGEAIAWLVELERLTGRSAPVARDLMLGWLARAGAAVGAATAADADGDRLLLLDASATKSPIGVAAIGAPALVHPGRLLAALGERLPPPRGLTAFLAQNSRSFRFASRFFAPVDAEPVARVYAFCRVTDDLVDGPASPHGTPEELLDLWFELSQRSFAGQVSGIPFLDEVMRDMREAGIDFAYASELVEGMRMDLRRARYASMAELREYTYRVASVVGCWLTELWGVRDTGTLERAAELGHAMQLTNILRDVGEDLASDRLYLPLDLLETHGLTIADLRRMRSSGGITPAYRGVVESLMADADRAYQSAFVAIPRLPAECQRPVAVAARVYQGIHGEIRRLGFDNLRHRAHTSSRRKMGLAAQALWELAGASPVAAS